MSMVLRDADTGYDIVFFVRRGKPYLWLRHPRTKRWLRKLDMIEVKAYVETRYSREEAKKRNPVYIDTVAMALATPSDIYEHGLERIKDSVMSSAWDWHTELFGSRIRKITEERGWEYSSVKYGREEHGEVYLHSIWARTAEDLEAGVGEEDEDVRPIQY